MTASNMLFRLRMQFLINRLAAVYGGRFLRRPLRVQPVIGQHGGDGAQREAYADEDAQLSRLCHGFPSRILTPPLSSNSIPAAAMMRFSSDV